jgi:hypothetical protein
VEIKGKESYFDVQVFEPIDNVLAALLGVSDLALQELLLNSFSAGAELRHLICRSQRAVC